MSFGIGILRSRSGAQESLLASPDDYFIDSLNESFVRQALAKVYQPPRLVSEGPLTEDHIRTLQALMRGKRVVPDPDIPEPGESPYLIMKVPYKETIFRLFRRQCGDATNCTDFLAGLFPDIVNCDVARLYVDPLSCHSTVQDFTCKQSSFGLPPSTKQRIGRTMSMGFGRPTGPKIGEEGEVLSGLSDGDLGEVLSDFPDGDLD